MFDVLVLVFTQLIHLFDFFIFDTLTLLKLLLHILDCHLILEFTFIYSQHQFLLVFQF